jgi:hypothetical protein
MQLHGVCAPTYRGLRKEKNTTDEAFFLHLNTSLASPFFLFFYDCSTIDDAFLRKKKQNFVFFDSLRHLCLNKNISPYSIDV